MECAHLHHVSPTLPLAAPAPAPACAECSVTEQNWLCLCCGAVSCGRYANGHAQRHAELRDHQLCMSCEQYSVYCYICDDYVTNDTEDHRIDSIRQNLMKISNLSHNISNEGVDTSSDNVPILDTCDPNKDDASPCSSSFVPSNEVSSSPLHLNEDSSDVVRNSPNRSVSSSPSTFTNTNTFASITDSGETKTKHVKTSEDMIRSLRPRCRKRSYSDDSNSTENLGYTQPKRKNSNGRKEKKVVGLKNLGNTCFMNAVLQSLSNIQEFSCYFNSLPSLEAKSNGRRVYHSRSYTRQEVQDVLMAEELRKVLINLSGGGSKGAISPECLFLVIWKVVPRFRGYQQQDAHEFLRYMLDRLHTELQQLLPADLGMGQGVYYSMAQRGRTSIVTTVFGGTLQSEVRCLVCGAESKKHDPFLDLSLDLPECPRHGAPLALHDCLSSFVQVEELGDTERYFCGSCKSKQKSTKQFWIRRLPNVLCLHLKRFRWNNFFRTKVDTDISFPLDSLDMSPYVLSNLPETRRSHAGSNLYDLAAVVVHHGSGAASGHYTAFAINGDQWFHFNDQTVRPIDVETVVSCKPYILFYIRREFTLPLQDAAGPHHHLHHLHHRAATQ